MKCRLFQLIICALIVLRVVLIYEADRPGGSRTATKNEP